MSGPAALVLTLVVILASVFRRLVSKKGHHHNQLLVNTLQTNDERSSIYPDRLLEFQKQFRCSCPGHVLSIRPHDQAKRRIRNDMLFIGDMDCSFYKRTLPACDLSSLSSFRSLALLSRPRSLPSSRFSAPSLLRSFSFARSFASLVR